MAKFYTSAGWLTPYAMACGYIHQQKRGDGADVTLERVSSDGSAYRVTVRVGARLDFDHVAHSVGEARREFKDRIGRLQYRFESAPDVSRNVIA